MPEESKPNHSVIVLIIIALVLIGVVYFLLKKPSSPDGTNQEEVTKENVVVKNTNLSAAGAPEQKLPFGFPKSIPVELDGIVESYSAEYPERSIMQYTISFGTDDSTDTAFSEYSSFMKKNGYVFIENGENKAAGYLYGTKDNDDLSITISAQNGRTLVQMSYLDRR
jgi:hypothetical protein